jgi:hypothetical protein
MYKIKRFGKRFNNKCFTTYEEARKYVRRKVTQLAGKYYDDYTFLGFSITR